MNRAIFFVGLMFAQVAALFGQGATSAQACVVPPRRTSMQRVPSVAVARQFVADNPGDPTFLKLYWQVLRASGWYTASAIAGERFVLLDTAAADSTYFIRQMSDAISACQFGRAAQFAIVNYAHYPNDSSTRVYELA